jgi:hypothetical protein
LNFNDFNAKPFHYLVHFPMHSPLCHLLWTLIWKDHCVVWLVDWCTSSWSNTLRRIYPRSVYRKDRGLWTTWIRPS